MQSTTDPVGGEPLEAPGTHGAAPSPEPGRGFRGALVAGIAASVVVLAGVIIVAIVMAGGKDEVRVASPSGRASSTTMDVDSIRADYQREVQRACAVISADLSLEVDDVFRQDERYEELAEFGPNKDVTACVQPARDAERQRQADAAAAAAAAEQQRQAEAAAAAAAAEQAAIDNAGSVDVDAIVKNPDAVTGQVFRMTVEITQMDAATGACVFRGVWDSRPHEYNFEYDGDNAMFSSQPTITPTTDCPILDGIDQDDTVTIVARSQGSYSYDTQIGGNTTVPLFQVLRVDGVSKG